MIQQAQLPGILAAASLILPLLLSSPLEPFTPRALIHSHRLYPLFLTPWATQSTLCALVARLTQASTLLVIPHSRAALGWGYAYTLLLNLLRTTVGFIFSRSVGWAYPALFSHWALYEPSVGIGPPLLALMAVEMTAVPAWRYRWLVIPALTTGWCVLERAPWTYGPSTLLSMALALGYRIARPARKGCTLAPGSPNSGIEPDDEKTTSRPPSHLGGPSLAFLGLLISYFILDYRSTFRLPFPSSPTPLLDVIVLSYPRPVDIAISTHILRTTIDSYLPHLHDITLSAFTHHSFHPAFDEIQADYLAVTSHTDTDTHPGERPDQYLHLAEAFRWAYEREGRAEWVMLVEDDFPVCPGGWEVVGTVMAMLENRRTAREGDIGSGFVGTGGSGLIIHHTLLPLLSRLLRLHSTDIVPASFVRPPPDVLVQDCLLGRPGVCERDRKDKGRMIISSRLVQDHIGGMATTTEGKALNSDKWRCGWRSGLHGEEGVDVVVV